MAKISIKVLLIFRIETNVESMTCCQTIPEEINYNVQDVSQYRTLCKRSASHPARMTAAASDSGKNDFTYPYDQAQISPN